MRSLYQRVNNSKVRQNRFRAHSLIELLCVLGIIAILSAMYLPVIARAFLRVKKFLFGL